VLVYSVLTIYNEE